MTLDVRIAEAGKNWCASASGPEVNGTVVATGKTRAAALKEFRSALAFHLDGLREDGVEVPEIDGLEVRELIAV
jgi:predicted RNase H-like HicB family nuclease